MRPDDRPALGCGTGRVFMRVKVADDDRELLRLLEVDVWAAVWRIPNLCPHRGRSREHQRGRVGGEEGFYQQKETRCKLRRSSHRFCRPTCSDF